MTLDRLSGMLVQVETVAAACPMYLLSHANPLRLLQESGVSTTRTSLRQTNIIPTRPSIISLPQSRSESVGGLSVPLPSLAVLLQRIRRLFSNDVSREDLQSYILRSSSFIDSQSGRSSTRMSTKGIQGTRRRIQVIGDFWFCLRRK